MNRRGFLGSVLALAAAPAIVRASSIMPVRVLDWPTSGIIPATWPMHTPSCPCISCIVTRTLQARSHTLAENVTRNNALLAAFHDGRAQWPMDWRPVGDGMRIVVPRDYA